MHRIRYEGASERQAIVDFLEKQLFRVSPTEDEVSQLAYDMWKDLRGTILRGEYKK